MTRGTRKYRIRGGMFNTRDTWNKVKSGHWLPCWAYSKQPKCTVTGQVMEKVEGAVTGQSSSVMGGRRARRTARRARRTGRKVRRTVRRARRTARRARRTGRKVRRTSRKVRRTRRH